ncbi:uncharacterized protein LOC131293347 [Anopheles ziemanni]|uniref:uncharacterized protein LOC131264185 n=1 Tax=Anopheles coustani TaxID=139045 RepID=UPI002658E981|nr:uncharacterized protein LOC131264185 [Anopheles coustani]XP_058177410.1 uncharacterized protein LOC131293347 [Anopheles ziemanni]
MSLIATCVLCHEKLPYCASNSGTLIQHLRCKHPEEVFGYPKIFSRDMMPQRNIQSAGPKKTNTTESPNAKSTNVDSFGEVTATVHQTNAKVHQRQERKVVYKTTVAEWHPARFRVHCRNCNGRFFPTVRMATSRVSHSAFAAACVLSCWPLCFLPCLFNRPTKHHLHCANCHAYLGLYDARRDCLDEKSRPRTN